MFQLAVKDLARIKSLAIAAKYDQATITILDESIQNISVNSRPSRYLTKEELAQLSINQKIKRLLILLFLVENVILMFLKQKASYKNSKIQAKDHWHQIENTLIKRLKLSRDIAPLFENNEINQLITAAQTIVISDLCTEEFVSRSHNIKISLNTTGKYDLQYLKPDEKPQDHQREEFDLYERQIYCHVGIYDGFNFVAPDTLTAFRYLNNHANRQAIDSLITLKFAIPVLFVLNLDGTFEEIPYDYITSFLEGKLDQQEIDENVFNAVKKDYPQLFHPLLDIEAIKRIEQKITHLIEAAHQEAEKRKKPLLIALSEVHGSKGSFLLHVITLMIARTFAINHVFVETINVYHKQWGSNPLVDEILYLIAFAEKQLGMHVKDLEVQLHYNDSLSPYPYYEIPLDAFGIPVREASWVIDVQAVKESAVLIVGCGHLNNMLSSKLQTSHYMLPIDCSCDKAFSDMLDITKHNHIELNASLVNMSLEEIVNMVQAYWKVK